MPGFTTASLHRHSRTRALQKKALGAYNALGIDTGTFPGSLNIILQLEPLHPVGNAAVLVSLLGYKVKCLQSCPVHAEPSAPELFGYHAQKRQFYAKEQHNLLISTTIWQVMPRFSLPQKRWEAAAATPLSPLLGDSLRSHCRRVFQ